MRVLLSGKLSDSGNFCADDEEIDFNRAGRHNKKKTEADAAVVDVGCCGSIKLRLNQDFAFSWTCLTRVVPSALVSCYRPRLVGGGR